MDITSLSNEECQTNFFGLVRWRSGGVVWAGQVKISGWLGEGFSRHSVPWPALTVTFTNSSRAS
eukprot:1145722-Pelagomonas_calceolata.AAC.3